MEEGRLLTFDQLKYGGAFIEVLHLPSLPAIPANVARGLDSTRPVCTNWTVFNMAAIVVDS